MIFIFLTLSTVIITSRNIQRATTVNDVLRFVLTVCVTVFYIYYYYYIIFLSYGATYDFTFQDRKFLYKRHRNGSSF